MALWKALQKLFICSGRLSLNDDHSMEEIKTQKIKSVLRQVHPLSAEKATECFASAPPIESYTQSTPTLAAETLQKTQRRLEEWDYDLRRREHALIILRAPKNVENNWPASFPLIYHNISVAIPLQHQSLMYLAYWTWKLTVAAYIFNWILIFVSFLVAFGNVSFMDWVIVTLGTGVGIPLSFQMAYYPLYKAAEENDNLYSVCWRFHMGCAILWSFLMVLGLPFLGTTHPLYSGIRKLSVGHISAGLWYVIIAMKTDADILGFACFTNSILWTVILIFQVMIVKRVQETSSFQNIPYEESNCLQGI